ncbi:TcpQ domain-containing protein [Pseudomonas cichorii]|nr:toxin co-regulated pilus biosynthesis Q family protein [Pseudomonas cichorii]MBX8493158.1 TcpQ domain-containing protein [Pseudomonas cichorii]
MRKLLYLATAIAALSGCKTAPPPDQPAADHFLDQQIASSAAAISLSQLRLHQTSAAPLSATLPVAQVAKVSVPATTIATPPVTAPMVTATTGPESVKPGTTGATAVTVVQAKAALGAASTSTSKPQKVIPGKVIPTAVVPPVVEAKVVIPPKPLPEPWVITPNDVTLRRAMLKWVARAGWQLDWAASVDIPLTVKASFTGDFTTAVKAVFQSLSGTDVKLDPVLYTGNQVLRVIEIGRIAK